MSDIRFCAITYNKDIWSFWTESIIPNYRSRSSFPHLGPDPNNPFAVTILVHSPSVSPCLLTSSCPLPSPISQYPPHDMLCSMSQAVGEREKHGVLTSKKKPLLPTSYSQEQSSFPAESHRAVRLQRRGPEGNGKMSRRGPE